MQSVRALFLVRALKPQQPLLAIKPAGISVERSVGRHHAMARHDNRNGITRDCGPHGTGRHNGRFISRYTMSSRNTLGDLTIRSNLATRNRKQLVPNFTLKRRANQMQRRRKPRFLPCKISIQPSPRTLKHRRRRTIAGLTDDMPPAPETASAPSTCSGSSLRSVEPKCSCPSNQSPVRPRPSAASKISPKGEANVVVTTGGSFQNSAP